MERFELSFTTPITDKGLEGLTGYTPMTKCYNCGKETTNPKFCSRSCSVITSNKAKPKRKTTKVCLVCSSPVLSYRHNRCKVHLEEYKLNKFRNKTIGEYRSLLSVKGKPPSWVNTHIRLFARTWFKHLRKKPCAHCGYTKHVELAHIKAVSEFPDSSLLSEVNSESNIIQLCPNCHWEFDNLPRKS